MRDKAYYTTKEWQARCEAVKMRCRARCEYCGSRPVQNVHHRTYARWMQEPLEDLMGVCRACHCLIHGLRNTVHIADGSLADQGDSGMGTSAVWRGYLGALRRGEREGA
jgi:phage terminase large subunit GpA-like protein